MCVTRVAKYEGELEPVVCCSSAYCVFGFCEPIYLSYRLPWQDIAARVASRADKRAFF